MSQQRKRYVASQKQKLLAKQQEVLQKEVPAKVPEKREEKTKESLHRSNSIELEAANIQRENENIYQRLSEIEQEEKVHIINKTEALRQLAENYERLRKIGKYTEPQNHICSTICHELKAKGLWASESLAHKVLDEKYKQTQFDPTINMSPAAYATNQSPYVINDVATTQAAGYTHVSNPPMYMQPFEQQLEQQKKKKSIDEMTKEEIRELTEETLTLEKQATEQQRELRRRRREYIAKCIEKKIALSEEFQNHMQSHISTQTDDSGMSEAVKAVYEHIEVWEKVAEKLIKFRPPPDMAEKIAYYLRAETEFLKPWADEKYRKDTVNWILTEIENVWHGKHGSAKRTATMIQGKDLPKNVERCLTREQVGDKYESVYRQALMLQTAFKYKMEISKWYMAYPEKKIAKRAYELGPVLSEKAFSGT